MFDLIAEGHRRSPHGDTTPIALSLGLHSLLVCVVAVGPLLYVTNSIPDLPVALAFVAAPPTPPPPPPPPPRSVAKAEPVRVVNPTAAPVEIPTEIAPERPETDRSFEQPAIISGVVGGPIADIEPVAPPPLPEPARPVRIGGAIRQPKLVTRVSPEYPAMAVSARVQGLVVLEAIVGPDGRVQEARVLRSIPLLDMAAMDAVRRWRYEPLVLQGQAVSFVLTVTVSFALTAQ